ncbi:unnamed protein product [Ilex paraguariensis]
MRDGGYCGQQVHANAINLGVNLKSYVQCGLVDMYGKFGLVKDARRVFEINAACWDAMLHGFIQHGLCVEAIKVLHMGFGYRWNAKFSSTNCSVPRHRPTIFIQLSTRHSNSVRASEAHMYVATCVEVVSTCGDAGSSYVLN